MKNYIKAISVGSAAWALPFLALAQGFSTTTAESLFDTAVTDLGSLLATVIGAVLVVVVGLLGLGMAIRYVKRYITGRKF